MLVYFGWLSVDCFCLNAEILYMIHIILEETDHTKEYMQKEKGNTFHFFQAYPKRIPWKKSEYPPIPQNKMFLFFAPSQQQLLKETKIIDEGGFRERKPLCGGFYTKEEEEEE